jgi:hypothetical protein
MRLVYHEAIPVAFAGLVPSTRAFNAGYFCCVGVSKSHRDARVGSPRTAQWMELHGFGYNGKSCFRQQFHPGWLSALPAAIPMGVAEHAVLAQAYQVKQP